MLEYLHLRSGAGPRITMELAPRFNVITGDNGLGKSFLLDSPVGPHTTLAQRGEPPAHFRYEGSSL